MVRRLARLHTQQSGLRLIKPRRRGIENAVGGCARTGDSAVVGQFEPRDIATGGVDLYAHHIGADRDRRPGRPGYGWRGRRSRNRWCSGCRRAGACRGRGQGALLQRGWRHRLRALRLPGLVDEKRDDQQQGHQHEPDGFHDDSGGFSGGRRAGASTRAQDRDRQGAQGGSAAAAARPACYHAMRQTGAPRGQRRRSNWDETGSAARGTG
jgi:hypothetical protein